MEIRSYTLTTDPQAAWAFATDALAQRVCDALNGGTLFRFSVVENADPGRTYDQLLIAVYREDGVGVGFIEVYNVA